MNKNKLLEVIIEKLELDRTALAEAAQATYEAATHEESKPENEYDTRGIEASYLAGAQSQRITEIDEAIFACKAMELKKFGSKDPIYVGALVDVQLEDRKKSIFLLPMGGGLTIDFEGKKIQVVTVLSPLGRSLLGLKAGETAIVEANNEVKEYEILSVE